MKFMQRCLINMTVITSAVISMQAHAEVYDCKGTYYDGSPMHIVVNSDNGTINIDGKVSLDIISFEHSNGDNNYTSNSFILPDNKNAYILVRDKQDDSTIMHIYNANTRTELYSDKLDCE